MSITTEIIVCKKCKGSGIKKVPGELYDPHKGLYSDPTYEMCKKCMGSGRQVITTKISIDPYYPHDEG
jgi:hypothetical protein